MLSSDETYIYVLFPPHIPQPLKSNKRGGSILLFFHKAPLGRMTVIHVNSSFVPCSSHYQPCCSYYASTSSPLIKMNALRCSPCFAFCLPKRGSQVQCTELVYYIVVGESCGFFPPTYLFLCLSS